MARHAAFRLIVGFGLALAALPAAAGQPFTLGADGGVRVVVDTETTVALSPEIRTSLDAALALRADVDVQAALERVMTGLAPDTLAAVLVYAAATAPERIAPITAAALSADPEIGIRAVISISALPRIDPAAVLDGARRSGQEAALTRLAGILLGRIATAAGGVESQADQRPRALSSRTSPSR